MVKRQGAAKTQSEINGICSALKILSENDCMTMFLSTSNMVSQTPIYNSYPVGGDNSAINARLKLIGKSLDSIMTSEQMNIVDLQSDPPGRTMLSDKKEVNTNQLERMSQLVANGATWANIVANNANPPNTKLTEENTDDNGWTNVSLKHQKKHGDNA